MEMTMRAATLTERLYACKQSEHIGSRCGAVGCLRGDMGGDGQDFDTTWEHCCRHLWTGEFLVDREKVLDALRHDAQYGGVLKNRDSLMAYCGDHPESDMGHLTRECAFRMDTEQYSYLLRLYPNNLEFDFELYPYRRDLFDLHMERAEQGIRFVTPGGREKFRVPDGEHIRIFTGGGETRDRIARYIDDDNIELVHEWGSNSYHIREFSERLEHTGGRVIPMRSTLPDKCYSVLPNGDEIITVKKGEDGYYHTDKYGHDRQAAQAIVDEYNAQLGVTKAQEAAMLAGSMFGWHTPAADPKNYDGQGHLIKQRPHDRGVAR